MRLARLAAARAKTSGAPRVDEGLFHNPCGVRTPPLKKHEEFPRRIPSDSSLVPVGVLPSALQVYRLHYGALPLRRRLGLPPALT